MTDEKLKSLLAKRAPCCLYDVNEVEKRAEKLKRAMEGCKILCSV